MKQFNPSAATATLLCLTLAACGGGGGSGGGASSGGGGSNPGGPGDGTPPEPLSSRGFAQTGDVIVSGVEFQSKPFLLLSVSETGEIETVEVDPNLIYTAFGSTEFVNLTMEFDAEDLERLGDNPTRSFGVSTGQTGIFQRRFIDLNIDGTELRLTRLDQADSGAVELAAVQIADFPLQVAAQGGVFAYGFDTDPAEITALTGSATYTGVAQMGALQADNTPNRGYTFAGVIPNDRPDESTFVLTANFDSNTIGGTLNVAEIDALDVPAFTATFRNAPIRQNAFGAGLSSNDLPDGLTFESGSYSGTFFGVDGASVGGTFDAVIADSGAEDILLQGGFVGDK